MSGADLGYTIVYVGPKKVEFPPKMNNVVKGISKTELKLKLSKLKNDQILSIPAEDGGRPIAERDGEEK